MRFEPHPYQRAAIDFLLERPGAALWMEMGLGKTVCTLTAIEQLIYDRFAARRALIVAPKTVAEATWQDEAAKWDHLRHLRLATALGAAAQRAAALAQEADVTVINRENIPWLVEHCGRAWPFDLVVLDEASSFKNPASARFKALRRVRPRIARVIELTGTPAPNNLLDLWAQLYLLDQGQRLGKYITHYRRDWFVPGKASGQVVYRWDPRPGAQAAIQRAIRDVVLSIRAAEHLALPGKVIDDIPVQLDAAAREAYRRLERSCLLEVDGETITAQQAAALTGKLLQLCNGSLYDEAGAVHRIHDCKLDAFDELIDALDGQHALVFYGFRFDEAQLTARLQARHKGLRFAVLRTAAEAAAWNAGALDLLLAHPASCAYGLNLQAGGHHLIWYSLPWSLELYEQGEARLYRQGQTQPVIVHRLTVKGGADELVVRALEGKDKAQQALLQTLNWKIKEARENL